MALIRSNRSMSEWSSYNLGDFEGQKQEFLKKTAVEAEEIVRKAREKAGQILKDAHRDGLSRAEDELKRKREEGFKSGYDEGMKQGKDEGLALEVNRVETELVPLVEELREALDRHDKVSSELIQGAEGTLVDTALDLAKNVIGIESSMNKEVLEVRLKKALRLIHVGLSLKLHISTGLRQYLEPVVAQWLKQEDLKTKLEWVEDDDMDPGSVVVSSEDAFVKFDSEMQWGALLKKLKLRDERSL